uniref:Uncharacterized protein n=1 Tax=Tetraselmis sp. GSL018 TaxID=582737 RepID=A0A061SBK6_9CHLO
MVRVQDKTANNFAENTRDARVPSNEECMGVFSSNCIKDPRCKEKACAKGGFSYLAEKENLSNSAKTTPVHKATRLETFRKPLQPANHIIPKLLPFSLGQRMIKHSEESSGFRLEVLCACQ